MIDIDLLKLNKELEADKNEYKFDAYKVSVIIPAYNIEGYICDCLQSVRNQSLSDIEIIVINDGSVDKTAEIVEIFAKHDLRIKLINQENQRVGAARNNGVTSAKGEYIVFVDGDDELENTAIEELYKTISSNGVDVAVFGASNFINNECKAGSYSVEKIPNNLKNKILYPEQIQKNLFKFPVLSMCKIYKKSFLEKNNIKFQKVRSGEDQIFHINSLLSAEKIYVLNKNLYKYRRNRKNSLTYSKQKKDNSPIMNFYAIEEFLRNNNFSKNLNYKILNKYFVKCVSWLGKCSAEYKSDYNKDLKELQSFLKKNYPEYYWKNVKFDEKSSYYGLKFNIIMGKFFRGENAK